jgi:hypothetical protein
MARAVKIQNVQEISISTLHSDALSLQLAIAALAQEAARTRIGINFGGAVYADNSTGVVGTELLPVNIPARSVVDGMTLFAPKTEFDAAIAAIRDANQESIGIINMFIGFISKGAYGIVRDLTGATGPDGNLDLITSTLTGAATGTVDAQSGYIQIVNAKNTQAAICSALNFVRVAIGAVVLPDGTGGLFDRVAGNGWTSYDSADTAASPAVGGSTLVLTGVNDALTALKNNAATLFHFATQVSSLGNNGPVTIAVSSANTVPSLVGNLS